ncbi:MAG: pyrimidine dimer DNA glycosylase/endonuclease V [Steroidobacter sp.]
MRLWTLHPKYLDSQGLVALWREALLARAVIRGETKGYRQHAQLHRFQALGAPRSAINAYLASVLLEAQSRGYSFDESKVGPIRTLVRIDCTDSQLLYEWEHLRRKLRARSPACFQHWCDVKSPEAHPLFRITSGPVASWERQIGLNESESRFASTPQRKRIANSS